MYFMYMITILCVRCDQGRSVAQKSEEANPVTQPN